jgi:hypothetical protein
MVSFKSTKEKIFFVGDLWDLTFTRIVNLLPSDSVVSVKILLILSIFFIYFQTVLEVDVGLLYLNIWIYNNINGVVIFVKEICTGSLFLLREVRPVCTDDT